MFGTLQDRLPKELRLAGLTDIEAANAFIRDRYLPAHNARFAVPPAGEGSPSPPFRRRPRRDPVRRGGAAGRQRQLRLLPHAQTSDPRKPDAAPFRQGAGQGHVSRTAPTPSFTDPDASAATTKRPARPRRRARRSAGANPLRGMTSFALTPPTGEQNQKKRTFDVLPKPDNSIRYRHNFA